jgi:hypothetical protein
LISQFPEKGTSLVENITLKSASNIPRAASTAPVPKLVKLHVGAVLLQALPFDLLADAIERRKDPPEPPQVAVGRVQRASSVPTTGTRSGSSWNNGEMIAARTLDPASRMSGRSEAARKAQT